MSKLHVASLVRRLTVPLAAVCLLAVMIACAASFLAHSNGSTGAVALPVIELGASGAGTTTASTAATQGSPSTTTEPEANSTSSTPDTGGARLAGKRQVVGAELRMDHGQGTGANGGASGSGLGR